ncbi:MAG: hypothetical protein IJ279_06660 [Clostridia bacterium]|nr:hypothetical protein [Clostridia bacterium]
MKDCLKNCGVILICFILIFAFTINTFAYIECDGNAKPYEWKDADDNVLFDRYDISGCCYHSAHAKFKYIEEDRRVYLAVFIDNYNAEDFDGSVSEIIVSFNNSSEVVLRSDLSADYDKDAFFLNFGYFSDESGGGVYEAEIVLKELEYENILTLNVTFKDYQGNSSQMYRLNIKSEEFKEEESESLSKAEKESEKKEKEESRSREKENKTKKTTTKKTSTKKYSSKTTKKKTTTKKESTTEYKTAIITENYESHVETLEKSNNSILIIGIACVVLSMLAIVIALFRKK